MPDYSFTCMSPSGWVCHKPQASRLQFQFSNYLASKQTNQQTKKLTANKQKANLLKSTKTSRLTFGNRRKLDQPGKGTASKSTKASMTGAYKNRDHAGSQSKSLKSQLKHLIHIETDNNLRFFCWELLGCRSGPGRLALQSARKRQRNQLNENKHTVTSKRPSNWSNSELEQTNYKRITSARSSGQR